MNEQFIWDYLYKKTGNAYGTAAIMGNLFAESSLNPKCRTGKTPLPIDAYTEAADQEKIEFAYDGVAYGLAQWCYWSRKAALRSYAKDHQKSVGDLQMQLDFMMDVELPKYKTVYKAVTEVTDIRTASDVFMTKYEKPGNIGFFAKEKRAKKAQEYYDQFYQKDESSDESKMVRIKTDSVNLRYGNGTNFPKAAQAQKDEIFKWVATSENNWHAVEYDGRYVFWCSGKYSEVI